MAPGMRTSDPRAPDGGWGWVVVFASFVQQALSIGVTYTFGVLLVDLLRYFDEKESTTAWIGSIQPCLLYFTGDMIIYDALSSEPEVHVSIADTSVQMFRLIMSNVC